MLIEVRLSHTCLLQKFSELVDFYFGHGLHRKALQLLASHIESQPLAHPLGGIYPTISYLRRLGPEQISFILEFSIAPLKLDPSESIEIFTREPGTPALPSDITLQHIEYHAPAAVIPYLEHLVFATHDETQDIHDKLVTRYLASVIDVRSVGEEDLSRARRKLRRMLRESRFVRVERLLAKMPKNGMPLRAISTEKLSLTLYH